MKFIGIDVAGLKKPQVIAVLDKDFKVNIFLEKVKNKNNLIRLANWLYKRCGRNSIVAIDAPRCLSTGPKNGRECEREIFRVFYPNARFQYTPTRNNFDRKRHEWMQVGFWFFEAFGRNKPNVIEVFPSVSYIMLEKSDIQFKLPIRLINKHYKADILDAITAAVIGYYYRLGQFKEYGDRGEGYIILPKI